MFYIIEIQKSASGNYAHLVQTAETLNSAESKYYGVLQYAAISELPLHSVSLIGDDGMMYASKAYRHEGGDPD